MCKQPYGAERAKELGLVDTIEYPDEFRAALDETVGGEADLVAIERRYREMIASARKDGYNVAANNLAYWLSGAGGIRTLSVAWGMIPDPPFEGAFTMAVTVMSFSVALTVVIAHTRS